MPYKDPIKQKEAQQKHYQGNKGKYAAASQAARSRKYKKYYELKDNPCVDCGFKFPPPLMHFDHMGEEEKDNHLSWMVVNVGWDTLMLEVAKCELVCSICHGLRTIERSIIKGTASQMLIDYYESFLANNLDKYSRPMLDL